jgi:hypothetical protein
MRVRTMRQILGALLVAGLLHGSRAAAQSCVGDCPPPNAQVAVNELILGVNIALGSRALDACPSYDANGNDAVGVEELITAVNNALNGCGGGATGSATPTSPPLTGGATPTVTPTVTWTPASGPSITFFGVANADDSLQDAAGETAQGIPIFRRLFGLGFKLVVEADGFFVGNPPDTYAPGGTPALQIQTTRALGNGSTAVCDGGTPTFGGVPGIDPPQLESPNGIADALNDFGCRFVNGEGDAVGRLCADACVRFDDGDFHCVDGDTDYQFCGPIDRPMEFPGGDTLVSVRVRDVRGVLGSAAQIIVRISMP